MKNLQIYLQTSWFNIYPKQPCQLFALLLTASTSNSKIYNLDKILYLCLTLNFQILKTPLINAFLK